MMYFMKYIVVFATTVWFVDAIRANTIPRPSDLEAKFHDSTHYKEDDSSRK